ncbi:phosphoribosylglycinamide formyltransferase [Pararobbsia silviterrae]|uniref:Phosphoribosylglycinamide formyltransferase n=1 Tax=Pararobbsia silviterrae TaxID=1792498 RepID=A0A494Y8V0_9BURK|nr:phosphoribosylglycinamide formyltransferase [Pararobbsia silviterrae]RKP56736.1 phosphoribosylglycinamide formyltransferase [Pararobbsia silviterrae]
MKNIVILISGRGSNMEAIVNSLAAERWPARIAAVISNRPDAAGLAFASSRGVPTAVVDHRDFADRETFDAQLRTVVDGYSPDLVVLGGFMRVLTAGFVDHYRGRMLNVHPSLLPSFPGLKTHARALAEGVKFHGATVHFVTADLDHGPIVLQGAVPVLAADTPDALQQRVLQIEHRIYPRAVRWFVEDRLSVDDGLATLTPPEPQWWFATEQA